MKNGVLSDLITSESYLSNANNKLTFDMQVGDNLTNILIKKGITA